MDVLWFTDIMYSEGRHYCEPSWPAVGQRTLLFKLNGGRGRSPCGKPRPKADATHVQTR
jgi:hypothetical protein